MNIKEEKICRLCLKVAIKDFQIIDEVTSEMFVDLSIEVNLDVSKDPIVCKDCTEILIKCFNFKSACMDTEESIRVNDGNKIMFEYQTGNETIICRFCCDYLSGNNFVLLDSLMNDVTFTETLHTLLPKMDFKITKNPVICTSCRQNLGCYIEFAKDCLDVEEKITKYCQNEGTVSSAHIKLSETLQFYSILESDYTQTYAIKQEDPLDDIVEARSEVYDSELVKAEEDLDIKEHETCETPLYMPTYKFEAEIGENEEASNEKAVNHTMISSKSEMGNITEVKMYKCSMCAYEAKRKSYLKDHMLVHEDVTKIRMYKCPECSYQAKKNANLTRHMLIHKNITEVEMYKCSTCTYQTRQKCDLNKHMIIHKNITEVEIYKCTTCAYYTRHKSTLKKHLLIHEDVTEDIMHKCAICDFKTKQKSYLKTHILIHSDIADVETYKCTTCPYETKHKGVLKNHMLIHKNIDEVEMYRCTACNYETKHKYSLKSHTLRHKNVTEVETYKCSTCNYETKRKGALKYHMLMHKNIKEVEMYKCSLCNHETKHKYSLKNHMLKHKNVTEVVMYKCSMCSHETKYKQSLKGHMLTHK